MMFTKVLAAIDLSGPSAEFVLGKAQTYVATGGALHVVHIIEPQLVQYSFDPTFTGSLTRSLKLFNWKSSETPVTPKRNWTERKRRPHPVVSFNTWEEPDP